MGEELETTQIKTDVLIIGGGIAGCMAGIRSRQCGAEVVLVEKANPQRSGSAGTGVDHFWTYAPEIHEPLGFTIEDQVIDHTRAAGGFTDQELTEFQARNSFERLLDWERWGIKIRGDDGKLDPVGKIHRVKSFMHFSGRDLKAVLNQQAVNHGVNIQSRTMIIDLILADDHLIGAVGIRTRENEVVCFLAKAVILATGGVMRLYKNPSGLLFNTSWSPAATGDGRAMAYRAGAKLVNMEIPGVHTGIRNFERCGRGSYHPGGVLRDAKGRAIAEAVKDHIDCGIESHDLILEVIRSGRGPVYMDCTEAGKDDLKYIRWALSNEGQSGYLNYLDQEGISLGSHKLEFEVYEMFLGMRGQGIKANVRCETSVPGLYVCGDDMGGAYRMVSPGAATFGWMAGENAAEYAMSMDSESIREPAEEATIRLSRMCSELLSRKVGTTWQDVNLAIQNIMNFYARDVRSESMLKAGLDSIQEVQSIAPGKMKAVNAHELMHCFEALNLAQVGEIIMQCSLNRKETRPEIDFFRPDYPEQEYVKGLQFQIIQLVGSVPHSSWEAIKYKYEWKA